MCSFILQNHFKGRICHTAVNCPLEAGGEKCWVVQQHKNAPAKPIALPIGYSSHLGNAKPVNGGSHSWIFLTPLENLLTCFIFHLSLLAIVFTYLLIILFLPLEHENSYLVHFALQLLEWSWTLGK